MTTALLRSSRAPVGEIFLIRQSMLELRLLKTIFAPRKLRERESVRRSAIDETLMSNIRRDFSEITARKFRKRLLEPVALTILAPNRRGDCDQESGCAGLSWGAGSRLSLLGRRLGPVAIRALQVHGETKEGAVLEHDHALLRLQPLQRIRECFGIDQLGLRDGSVRLDFAAPPGRHVRQHRLMLFPKLRILVEGDEGVRVVEPEIGVASLEGVGAG